MNRAIPMLRLTPQAAGTLQQQHTKATQELRALIRHDALRQLHKATDNALLLADLVREAA